MPNFEDWRRSHQEGVENYIEYFINKGYSSKRARELALIEQNIITKRAQDQLGELPGPFEVKQIETLINDALTAIEGNKENG